MRLTSSTNWERIFTTIRNLFHTFMFYILKSAYLYPSRDFFFKINIFFYVFYLFLAIFRTKITTILTLSILEGGEWEWSHFTFLEVINYKSAMLIYVHIYMYFTLFSSNKWQKLLTNFSQKQSNRKDKNVNGKPK